MTPNVNTNGSAPAGRIAVLDAYRGIAVLAVVGFHFFSRWTPPLADTNLYPYGAALAAFPLFRYGYLGVHLFFLVSGFVITLTLTKCANWREFVVRRFARLFPAMLLCATATYVVIRLTPPHIWSVTACSFLPSLTFFSPSAYSWALKRSCEFMDPAYWSLWVEVRFYAVAALLYFGASREGFLRNSFVVMNLAIVVLFLEHGGRNLPGLQMADRILFPEFAPWLFSGVAFFYVRERSPGVLAWLLLAEAMTTNVVRSIADLGGAEWIVIIVIYGLFWAFAVRQRAVDLFDTRLLVKIGTASYAFYLLHQYIGVTLIAFVGQALAVNGPPAILIAAVVAIALAIAAVGIFNSFESPMRRWITERGTALFGRSV